MGNSYWRISSTWNLEGIMDGISVVALILLGSLFGLMLIEGLFIVLDEILG